MKILIAAHAGFSDFALLERKLELLLGKLRRPALTLVHDDPAAHLADLWASANDVKTEVIHPDFKKETFAAESAAFEKACETCDALVLFVGKGFDVDRPGTDRERSILARARKHLLKVRIIIKPEGKKRCHSR